MCRTLTHRRNPENKMRDTMGAHVKIKGPTNIHRKGSIFPQGVMPYRYQPCQHFDPGQNVRHKQLQGGNFIFSNGLRRLHSWLLALMPGYNDDKKQKEGCRTGQAKQHVQGHIRPY